MKDEKAVQVGNAQADAITVEKDSLELALAKVSVSLKNPNFLKVLRFANKNVNANIKLNDFMTCKDFDKAIPSTFRTGDNMQAKLAKLIGENEDSILTNVSLMKTLLAVICEELVNAEVAAKAEWLSTYGLDEKQQIVAARQLKAYKGSLMVAVRNSEPMKQLYA